MTKFVYNQTTFCHQTDLKYVVLPIMIIKRERCLPMTRVPEALVPMTVKQNNAWEREDLSFIDVDAVDLFFCDVANTYVTTCMSFCITNY